MRVQIPETRNGRLKLFGFLTALLIASITFSILTSKPETSGDKAAKDSPAFLIYKDQTYEPTSKVQTNLLIAQDVAYFARKTLPVYDPEIHPAVVFKIDKISTSAGMQVLKGKFERSKDSIEVTYKIEANERITNTVKNLKSQVSLSEELPSNNALNKFIKSLPLDKTDFIVEYISRDGSVSVSLGDANPIDLKNAKQFVADSLGVSIEQLKSYPVRYTFPTDLDEETQPIPHD